MKQERRFCLCLLKRLQRTQYKGRDVINPQTEQALQKTARPAGRVTVLVNHHLHFTSPRTPAQSMVLSSITTKNSTCSKNILPKQDYQHPPELVLSPDQGNTHSILLEAADMSNKQCTITVYVPRLLTEQLRTCYLVPVNSLLA